MCVCVCVCVVGQLHRTAGGCDEDTCADACDVRRRDVQGSQFTCFTRTKVQILTAEEQGSEKEHYAARRAYLAKHKRQAHIAAGAAVSSGKKKLC